VKKSFVTFSILFLFGIISVAITPASASVVSPIANPPIVLTEDAGFIRLDFNMFIVEFYKGSSGYNKIYDGDGAVLVYDDRVVLQYLALPQERWNQRGTPIDISWVKISDYHYNVTRYYDDYLGTLCNITYGVKSNEAMKFSVSIYSAQTDEYRVAWFPSGITRENYFEGNNSVTFGLGFDSIEFNWDDVYQTFGNITDVSYEDVAQGKKANIYFGVGIINSGESLLLDPSIVATTGTYTYGHGFQRKSFHAEGYFFQFYGNSSLKINYKSSTDGDTWGSETYFRDGTSAEFSLWFDGTYVHTVYAEASYGGTIYYRRGNPETDGTITWDAEQTVHSDTGWLAWEPTITVNSTGYPYIFTHWEKSSTFTRLVMHSNANDGTWSNATGYPMNLTTHDAEPIPGLILPLTSGKMYAIWSPYEVDTNYYGRLYNGSDWEANVTICPTDYHDIEFFSAVSKNDDVHLVFGNRTNVESPYDYRLRYVNYTSGSWENTEDITSLSGEPKAISIEDADTEFFIYCNFFDVVTKTWYWRGTSGNWGGSDEINWSQYPDDNADTEFTSFRENWGGYHSCTAVTGGTQKLEFWYEGPPTNDACDSTSTQYVDTYGWVNLTVSDIDYVADFKTVDIQVNTTGDAETFTLRWTQATDTFSEISDASGICTLDAATSTRQNIDSDTDKIAFYFKFTSGTEGACDVNATTTDDNDLTDIDTYTSEFTMAVNQPPTIGTFQAPGTAYAGEYFFLNCSVQDLNGKDEIVNATIEISNSIILKYDNASDTFSEYQDTNGYCTLDAGSSVRTEINSTAFKLSWKIKLSYSCPEGQISVIVTNTKVFDSLDDSGSGSQSNLFYFDKKFTLNLRSVDSESDAITDVTVYMDNGTEYSASPDSGGWANWTAITTSTVDVTVKFYGIQVNSTTITMDDNKTIDLSCECYPFTPTATKYYVASNSTISSATWNSTTNDLEIAFSGATATYNLTSSHASEPTYVLNCTFDIDTDWGTYLSLTHYGNRTITLGYPNWATTRVYRTDHILTNAYWAEAGVTLYIVLNGTSGQSGTLEIYCGSRRAPIDTSGLTDGVYFSSTQILAGTYSFSSTTTVTLDWTEGSSGGVLTPPNVFLTAKTIEIGSIRQGTSITFNATATWTGIRTIIFTDITFEGDGSEWFTAQIDLLPLTIELAHTESEGTIQVPITITVPSQGKLGSYSVLIEYEIQVGMATYQTTANVLFDVVITIPSEGVPDLVSWLLLIVLIAIPVIWIKRKTEKK